MKIARIVMTVILSVSCGLVLAAKPIQNFVDVPVPVNADGSNPGIEKVKGAIVAGCGEKGWAPVLNENNNITCSILVRSRHFAEVEITYTESTYSITYKDSRELDYNEKKQKIHRNYNKWVILLSDSIQRQFANTG